MGFGMTAAIYGANPLEDSIDETRQEELRLEEMRLMEEWRHIITATKKVSTDKEMQRAVQQAADAIQNMLSVGIKKIARAVSPAERAKLGVMMQLLQRMVEVSSNAVYTGNGLEGDDADEVRQIGQTLLMLMAPLMILSQDPQFVTEQAASLQNARVGIYRNVKKTVDQLSNDIQSVR